MTFRDRTDAGNRLAEPIVALALAEPVLLALPRGGVVVAAPVAARLGVPLEVVVARKVGLPGQPELAIGAVAEGGVTVGDHDMLEALAVTEEQFFDLADAERVELDRRVAAFHHGHTPDLLGRDVVIVDDGLATGFTAEAAIEAVRMRKPRRIVLAVPVAASAPLARLRGIADEVVCLSEPRGFDSVGRWYDRFDQVSDDEVRRVLTAASSPP